jgi:hypothetical protein
MEGLRSKAAIVTGVHDRIDEIDGCPAPSRAMFADFRGTWSSE